MARRFAIAAVAAGALAMAAGVFAADEGLVRTSVRQTDDVYQVDGRFQVPAPRPVVWSVLTDYEHLGDFVSSIRHCAVTGRCADGVTVEQVGVGRVMFLSKRIHVRLDVRERPQELIAFEDRSGESFVEYVGQWRLAEADGWTSVSYELRARPTFRAPGMLARKTMRDSVSQLLDEVRTEILARVRRQAELAARK